ncbi:MAG TPA: hypothetical protein PLR25_28480 [Planctomycetaceae bacterium]|nr:hypothetical protein [Planctomycetaceae bacterium]
MKPQTSRRCFLSSASAGISMLSAQNLIAGLNPVSDEQARATSGIVQLRPEIEPLVRLIEESPRQRLLEEIGSRIQNGLSYREVLAALLLAGVRNIEPYPAVGFKFHAVLVVNAAHVASLASPSADRWLPILWALDEFKSSQAKDVKERNWTMAPVDEAGIPAPEKLRDEFHHSMQQWDVAQADVAVAGVARYLGATETLELFAAYAARDFRSIGHKAIYLANAWRTLQTIGWEHAEPVLRSLAYAMLNHNGEPNPATSDLAPDRAWKTNQQLSQKIRDGWEGGKSDGAATTELLTVLRAGTADESAACVVEQLNAGVSPQSLWDALHLAAGELVMRQAGIVPLHAITTTNALRFLFDNVGSPQTRKLLLLQNASFLPLFRAAMKARGQIGDSKIDELTGVETKEPVSVDAIFGSIGKQPQLAAQQVMTFLASDQDAETLMNAARRLIFLKGTDAHDYKFSTAALEDYYKISPALRSCYMAASTYNLKGSGATDNKLVDRIRVALG